MICFDIAINDRHVCRAGSPDGGLQAFVLWSRCDEPADEEYPECYRDGTITIGVTGGNSEWLWYWLARGLHIGDNATLSIVEAESADKPAVGVEQSADNTPELWHDWNNLSAKAFLESAPQERNSQKTCIGYAVTINGEHKCLAGVGLFGQLNVNLRHPYPALDLRPSRETGLPVAELTVLGVTDALLEVPEYLEWEKRGMATGDVVTVTVIATSNYDEPTFRGPD